MVLVDHLQKEERKNTKFKETRYSQYIFYKKELDKACFQHNMAYRDFKDLTNSFRLSIARISN